jgi:hypothetical protein
MISFQLDIEEILLAGGSPKYCNGAARLPFKVRQA